MNSLAAPRQKASARPGAAHKETIASRIMERVRSEILSGALAPGTKLNLLRLHETYQISLAPLREAMSRLAAEDLVEFEDQRGFRVAPVSAPNLNEIIQLRLKLEPLALRHSIEAGDLDWEANVLAGLHRLDRSESAIGDIAAREAAHSAFHMALIAGGGKPLLAGFCTRLRLLIDRYRRLYLSGQEDDPESRAEHGRLADLAVARDAAAASALLASHIARTGARLRNAHSARTVSGGPA